MGDFLEDRDLTLKIACRISEVMASEDFKKAYTESVDMTMREPASIMVKARLVHERFFRDMFDEFGIIYKDRSFSTIYREILRRYRHDEEIRRSLIETVTIESSDIKPIDIGAQAAVHAGFLKKLHEDFKDKVDIYMVYLREAHPIRNNQELSSHNSFIKQHEVIEDRINAAKMLIELGSKYDTFTSDIKDDTKVGILLDNMENSFCHAFAAMPVRVAVIEDGKLSFLGTTIEEQAAQGILMTDELRIWLAARFDTTN
ncbi:uncharacterized protein [Ptychodera flava]|uniref:uncharacterized protein n=1 Tax=Ptychodera flava TaxID=63121 RepID=UPI00396A33F3